MTPAPLAPPFRLDGWTYTPLRSVSFMGAEMIEVEMRDCDGRTTRAHFGQAVLDRMRMAAERGEA